MQGIYAWRLAAKMVDFAACRNGTDQRLICESVDRVAFVVDGDTAIAVGINPPRPEPAPIAVFANVRAEMRWKEQRETPACLGRIPNRPAQPSQDRASKQDGGAVVAPSLHRPFDASSAR